MGVCSVQKFKAVQSYPEGPHQPHDVGAFLQSQVALDSMVLWFRVIFPDCRMAPAAADYR